MPAFIAEAPAKLHSGHRMDRNLSAVAGGAVAWRNASEHPLTAALDAKKITHEEYAAGEFYRALFEKIHRSGRDSTQFAIVGSGGSVPFTDAQVTAIRWVEKIEGRLPRGGTNWPLIVRSFCGEGWSARQSCLKAGIKNPRFVWTTIRLALSKLSAAIEGVRVI